MTDHAVSTADATAPSVGMVFGRRILELADQLAKFSESNDHLSCTYLTPAHKATAAKLQAWMQTAGLDVEIDVLGNVVGRYASDNPEARTLIVGSHYDTVPNAGKYDGRVGILTGLVTLEHLARRGHCLPFHVELIAFAEEEGFRFGTSYLGSSAVAGRFDRAGLDRRDATGLSVGDAILAAGGDLDAIPALARSPHDLLGYLEVHIEQGPVLLQSGMPLGIVTAIAGCARYSITITGVAGHAGTVPMSRRHDAVAAAAEIALYVERRCREIPGLVGTIGQIAVPNGAINIIPARCELSLDIRADDEGKLAAAIADVMAHIAQTRSGRGVAVDIADLQRSPVLPCSPSVQRLLAAAIEKTGGPVHYLPSGAGHDAVMFKDVTPVGMLFVRCGNGGVSHNPLETITEADADLAARVFLDVLMTFHDPR